MADSDGDVLAQLGGRSPRRLLEDLSNLGKTLAANDRPRPELELHLSSGTLLRGRIVEVADGGGGAVVSLLVGGSLRAPTVSFVRVDQIAAVTVIDASLLVRSPVPDAPVPGKLELARMLAAHASTLAASVGRALPIELPAELDDDGRRAIGLLIPVLVEVLSAIAADPMGKDALSAIQAIEVHAGGSAEVARPDPRRVVVHAPRLLGEQFTAATLRTELEKVL